MKKHTNKFFFGLSIFALLALFVIAAFCVPNQVVAYALDVPTITVEDTTVHRGKTFELKAELTANSGLTGLTLEMNFDENAFTLLEVRRGNGLSSLNFTPSNFAVRKEYRFVWDGITPSTETGVLFTAVFQSNVVAPTGEYDIALSYDAGNTMADYLQPTSVDISGGNVTLTKGEYSVIYQNADSQNTVLFNRDYNSDDIPEYQGELPALQEDSKYTYSFSGWKGVVVPQSNLLVFEATYTRTPKTYKLFTYVDGELYDSSWVDYNYEFSIDSPKKVNYTFVGWYVDEAYTQKLTSAIMPDSDLRLYGYFRYNMREDNLPEIAIKYLQTIDDIAELELEVKVNTGLAYLLLHVDYDRANFVFDGFSKGAAFDDFSFTYIEGVSLGFSWDKIYTQSNSTQTGVILKLRFAKKQNTQPGTYPVDISVKDSDAVYYNNGFGTWYTKLILSDTFIPVGEVKKWSQTLPDLQADIKVNSQNPLPADTILNVDLVTDKLKRNLSSNNTEVLNQNNQITSVYSVSLVRENTVVNPDGTLTISIRLTEEEKQSNNLKLYAINEKGELVEQKATVMGSFLVFNTDKTGDFAIVGDKPQGLLPTYYFLIAALMFLGLVSIILLLIHNAIMKTKLKMYMRRAEGMEKK